jgi:hypothetical protein
MARGHGHGRGAPRALGALRKATPAARAHDLDRLDAYTVVRRTAPAMDAPLLPEVLLRREPSQPELALAAEGVQRYVWESRFGDMLIEVRDGRIFVNGSLVVPAATPQAAG